ncbi:hypothetical protein G7Y89_g2616 [Cudoniella acicularis]|uniref:Uncharacterized protein n=1 Tax=Cudoniella acicularis TaxID=354080 RepID=A0A8H4W5Y6_9HELO|nr:hypothetical protein G7Y89_g2616 [Cudoniella acicularis]
MFQSLCEYHPNPAVDAFPIFANTDPLATVFEDLSEYPDVTLKDTLFRQIEVYEKLHSAFILECDPADKSAISDVLANFQLFHNCLERIWESEYAQFEFVDETVGGMGNFREWFSWIEGHGALGDAWEASASEGRMWERRRVWEVVLDSFAASLPDEAESDQRVRFADEGETWIRKARDALVGEVAMVEGEESDDEVTLVGDEESGDEGFTSE